MYPTPEEFELALLALHEIELEEAAACDMEIAELVAVLCGEL